MGLLNAEAIKASPPKMVKVPVPEWGGADAFVMVRGMSGTLRFAFDDRGASHADEDFRARLAAFTLCDESGSLLFTPDSIPSLSHVDFAALDRVFKVAVELNKLSKVNIDDFEKN